MANQPKGRPRDGDAEVSRKDKPWTVHVDPAALKSPGWPGTLTAVNLLLGIEAHARTDTYTYVALKRLMEYAGGSKRRQCQTALGELEARGWIRVIHAGPSPKSRRLGFVMLRRTAPTDVPAADTEEKFAAAVGALRRRFKVAEPPSGIPATWQWTADRHGSGLPTDMAVDCRQNNDPLLTNTQPPSTHPQTPGGAEGGGRMEDFGSPSNAGTSAPIRTQGGRAGASKPRARVKAGKVPPLPPATPGNLPRRYRNDPGAVNYVVHMATRHFPNQAEIGRKVADALGDDGQMGVFRAVDISELMVSVAERNSNGDKIGHVWSYISKSLVRLEQSLELMPGWDFCNAPKVVEALRPWLNGFGLADELMPKVLEVTGMTGLGERYWVADVFMSLETAQSRVSRGEIWAQAVSQLERWRTARDGRAVHVYHIDSSYHLTIARFEDKQLSKGCV